MAKNTKKNQEKFYYQDRKSVPQEAKWKIEKMYQNTKDWQKDFNFVQKSIPKLKNYKGKLKIKSQLLKFFQDTYSLTRNIEKLYVFASHSLSVDLASQEYQILTQKAQDLYTLLPKTIAFYLPELASLSDSKLKEIIKDKSFNEYHKELNSILKLKKHILSEKEEALLSQVGKLTSGPDDIFSALDNVDLTFNFVNIDGKEVQLTNGNYQTFLENKDRKVRKEAFENLYKSYKSHINTFAQTLNLEIKQHNFFTQAKNFNSSLESSLSRNLIDKKVYTTLIEEAHKSLPILYKYFQYRAKKLKLKKLTMYDLRVNLTDTKPFKFTYDQAVELCLEAVKPLGADYCKVMEKGFKEGWVDRYENKGKRGGAYSGGCYDSDPYILMNFTGTLNDVYTLIHEGGHSMHSYLARHNQPYALADYSLFAAEIASTVNERLLTNYLLKKYQNNNQLKQNILAYEIDAIRATYFRQTMFAEFELLIHQSVDKGEPLTVQFFNQEYQKLNDLYYGPTIEKDDWIQYEWARIPHFYYNFYVYQYATGIAAAYYFAEQISNTKTSKNTAEKYLNFLKSGGNDFPLNQLKKTGLDFTKPDLHRALAKSLQKCLNQL